MNKKILLAVLLGFLTGILWFGVARFLVTKDETVHYHANFALYVNGEQDKFDSFTFYEEVAACNSNDAANPKGKVHLHDNVNHLVHVHAESMTWGYFFANLGYTLGDTVLKTDDGIYVDGQGDNELKFILNGEEVENIAGRVIGDQDVLLIDYGDVDSETLQKRYDDIPRTSEEANNTTDPAACAGNAEWNFTNRLKKSLGLQ